MGRKKCGHQWERLAAGDYYCLECGACADAPSMGEVLRLMKRVRKLKEKCISEYSRGYAAGSEDQMQMRVRDAMERK